MDRSFFHNLESSPTDAAADGPLDERSRTDERLLLDSLILIRRVTYGRLAFQPADIPDVIQEAALRLWKWRGKYVERSERMTSSEWDSFTARTVHNEINRYCVTRIKASEVPIEEAHSILDRTPEGEADAEMISLVRKVWQEICSLSLYQRRSLLLHSPELLIYFLQCGIEERNVFEALELSEEDWDQIAARLPLTDAEIATIAKPGKEARDPASARAVKKARFDARKKLKGLKR